MKKFLETMYAGPFVELTANFNELKTVNRFYLQMPEILRRCYFLQPSEKLVMFELISWAASNNESDEIGYCSVPEPIIRGNTNLSKSTVKKAIQSLQTKGFIDIRRYYDRRNKYKINPLARNPYALLSEYVHWIRQAVISNWEDTEKMFREYDALSYSVNAYTEATLAFVNRSEVYMPYIKRIKEAYGENFLEYYKAIFHDVELKLNELYDETHRRLKGRK
jgi:predicted transcriptional regulator